MLTTTISFCRRADVLQPRPIPRLEPLLVALRTHLSIFWGAQQDGEEQGHTEHCDLHLPLRCGESWVKLGKVRGRFIPPGLLLAPPPREPPGQSQAWQRHQQHGNRPSPGTESPLPPARIQPPSPASVQLPAWGSCTGKGPGIWGWWGGADRAPVRARHPTVTTHCSNKKLSSNSPPKPDLPISQCPSPPSTAISRCRLPPRAVFPSRTPPEMTPASNQGSLSRIVSAPSPAPWGNRGLGLTSLLGAPGSPGLGNTGRWEDNWGHGQWGPPGDWDRQSLEALGSTGECRAPGDEGSAWGKCWSGRSAQLQPTPFPLHCRLQTGPVPSHSLPRAEKRGGEYALPWPSPCHCLGLPCPPR